MKVIMDAEEKFAYDESLSNFVMLKVWHDMGIDVSNFSDYMAEPAGYSLDRPGAEILEQGFKSLFSDYEYLDYEELEKMEKIAKLSELYAMPEEMFILNNDKLRKLLNTEKIDQLIGDLSSEAGDLSEYEIVYHKKFGLIVAVFCPSLLFEIAISISTISRKIDSLYQKSEEVESNGLYRKAV